MKRYPIKLVEMYKDLTSMTLRIVIGDMMCLLDSTTDKIPRKELIERIALPMRIHIKYFEDSRDILLDYAINKNINIDVSYDGIEIIPK